MDDRNYDNFLGFLLFVQNFMEKKKVVRIMFFFLSVPFFKKNCDEILVSRFNYFSKLLMNKKRRKRK